jgi:hypothetical protein
MKYKVEPGNDLFEQLKTLFLRMVSCNKAAIDLCKLIAGEDAVPLIHGKYLAGGLDGIHNKVKPNMDIWRHMGDVENENYYPRPHNVETIKLFESLPRVAWRDLNSILGYLGNQTVKGKKGKMVVRGAAVKFHEDFILVKIHDNTKYRPLPDMIEIDDEEYYELEEKIKLKS